MKYYDRSLQRRISVSWSFIFYVKNICFTYDISECFTEGCSYSACIYIKTALYIALSTQFTQRMHI